MTPTDDREFAVHDIVEFMSDDDPPQVAQVGSVVAVWPEGYTIEWDDGKIGVLTFDWQLCHLRKAVSK